MCDRIELKARNQNPTRTAAMMLIILGSTLLKSDITSIQAYDLIINESRLKQLNKKAWPSLADVDFHKEMFAH